MNQKQLNLTVNLENGYFDYSDLRLVIYCLPQTWIQYIFKSALCRLIAQDKSIYINSKYIGVLKENNIDINVLRGMHLNPNIYNNIDIKNISRLINDYSINDIIEHMQYLFLENILKKIESRQLRRLNITTVQENLLNILGAIDLVSVIESTFRESMPNTYNAWTLLKQTTPSTGVA